MKTILVADAGSSKTEWMVGDSIFRTQGINPVFLTEQEILNILRDELLNCPQSEVLREQFAKAEELAIFFYGAGCTVEKSPWLRMVLQRFFSAVLSAPVSVFVASDMLGAARALLGRHPGIACILGTGANTCLYDGENIVMNTPALGFILGDEGSGAVLGKLFLNALLKGRLPQSVVDDFQREYKLQQADIIDRVYRQPLPNRFLASLSPFIRKHADLTEVRQLITSNFDAMFNNNLLPYLPHLRQLLSEQKTVGETELENADCTHSAFPRPVVSFVGSIAHYYSDILRDVAACHGYRVGRIEKAPVEKIMDYHNNSDAVL